MTEKYICPSMMCANFDNLKDEVSKLDEAGIDIFHIDIMDGQFVPNYGMGLQDIQSIRRSTNKKIDVHLMTMNPGNYIDLFVDLGVDIIYIHPESEIHPARTLSKIKEAGKISGIAINPGTSLSSVKDLLNLIDYLMIMTVNPGFAGQKYLDYVDEKIEEAVKLKEKYHYKIFVDGAISPEKIENLSKKGVEGFVLGTSSLFGKEKSYSEIILELRAL
ncbi:MULTISPECIES: ribulose-phosphate 3-epimerase [Helcococcus]|uniref:Ribulose-phosphate 3-epimerase n=1 Tax=Helcococcus bovis TaxID=3153252 RepID=A0ABW9F5V2_9FIRM